MKQGKRNFLQMSPKHCFVSRKGPNPLLDGLQSCHTQRYGRRRTGSKSEISQEDTASEAEVTTEEPLNGDKGEEDGLAWDECGDELENSHYTDVEDARLQ